MNWCWSYRKHAEDLRSMGIQTQTNGKIVVLGAGLAGLTAASKLSESFGGRVLLLEREAFTGGMSHTFSEEDLCYDYGSHRIHPSFTPKAMNLIRDLLGERLLLRERRGRLRLNGRYMDYPPDLLGFLRGLGVGNAFCGGMSFLAARLDGRPHSGPASSYEDCMTQRAGKVIYDLFYAPYAWKVYGIDPKTLSAHASKTRVSLKKPMTLVLDLLLPKKAEKKFFYYPHEGIGSIARELQRRFVSHGGNLLTNVSPQSIRLDSQRAQEIRFEQDGRMRSVPVDMLISTIPVNSLIPLFRPATDGIVGEAARALKWRAIRFLYLGLNRPFCRKSETHYYPETQFAFGRISEPKRFSPYMVRTPGKTLICVEVLCSAGDRLWRMEDAELFQHIQDDLKQVGLLASEKEVYRLFSKRLAEVYPVYEIGWERNFRAVDQFVAKIPNLFAIGRGSLFLHDNMDHAIQMGLKLSDFVIGNDRKNEGWSAALSTFRHYEVRD
jgi:protoporphyrinogen oxidase